MPALPSDRSLHLLDSLKPNTLPRRFESLVVIGRRGFCPRGDGAVLQQCALRVPERSDSGRPSVALPRPSQVGQEPKGLLNENSRGSISEIVKPETGHANFSGKQNTLMGFVERLVGGTTSRGFFWPEAACQQIRRRPDPRRILAHVSKLSASRGGNVRSAQQGGRRRRRCHACISYRAAGASAIS